MKHNRISHSWCCAFIYIQAGSKTSHILNKCCTNGLHPSLCVLFPHNWEFSWYVYTSITTSTWVLYCTLDVKRGEKCKCYRTTYIKGWTRLYIYLHIDIMHAHECDYLNSFMLLLLVLTPFFLSFDFRIPFLSFSAPDAVSPLSVMAPHLPIVSSWKLSL